MGNEHGRKSESHISSVWLDSRCQDMPTWYHANMVAKLWYVVPGSGSQVCL